MKLQDRCILYSVKWLTCVCEINQCVCEIILQDCHRVRAKSNVKFDLDLCHSHLSHILFKLNEQGYHFTQKDGQKQYTLLSILTFLDV